MVPFFMLWYKLTHEDESRGSQAQEARAEAQITACGAISITTEGRGRACVCVCGGVPPTGQEKWVLAIRVSNSKPGQENSSNSQLSYGYLGKVAQLGALSGPQFLGI